MSAFCRWEKVQLREGKGSDHGQDHPAEMEFKCRYKHSTEDFADGEFKSMF